MTDQPTAQPSEDQVGRVAKALDPEAWVDDLPIPTRADTIRFHERRKASSSNARAAIAAHEGMSLRDRFAGQALYGLHGIPITVAESKSVAQRCDCSTKGICK